MEYFRGPAFIPFIDSLPSLNRKNDGPFIMPIVDKYKDMGTVLMGKVESGECRKGQSMLIMPNRVSFVIPEVQISFIFQYSVLDSSNRGYAAFG